MPVSFADVLKGDTPTLATIKKYQGMSVCRAAIVVMVYWVKDNFNFGRNLTDIQAGTFADLLIGEFPHFTLADVKLAFIEGVKGNYGEVYQNIDPTTLFSWVRAYFNEKDRYLTEETRKRKEEEKTAVNLTPEEVSARWKKIIDSVEAKEQSFQRSSIVYRSLIHYCEVNELDLKEVTDYLNNRYTKKYEEEESEVKGLVPVEMYIRFRIQKFLHDRSKRDRDKIIEQTKEEIPDTISLKEYMAIKEAERLKYAKK